MILGIDADSKRLAYCALDSGAVVAVGTVIRANQAGRIDGRYDAMLTSLMRRVSELGGAVFLEGIYLGAGHARNVQGFAHLAEVAGEIKRAARLCAVPVETVSANAWHSAILGFTKPRAALKEAAQARAQAVTGREDLSEHEADAVCIALYGAETARDVPNVKAVANE